MLVKILEDKEDGVKTEIYKDGENDYSYKFFEYFQSCGWRFIEEEKHYSKDAIEYEFNITL